MTCTTKIVGLSRTQCRKAGCSRTEEAIHKCTTGCKGCTPMSESVAWKCSLVTLPPEMQHDHKLSVTLLDCTAISERVNCHLPAQMLGLAHKLNWCPDLLCIYIDLIIVQSLQLPDFANHRATVPDSLYNIACACLPLQNRTFDSAWNAKSKIYLSKLAACSTTRCLGHVN